MAKAPKVSVEKIKELKKRGYDYKAIAEELGTSEAYIKNYMYRHNHQKVKPKPKGITIPSTDLVITKNEEAIERAVGKMGDDKVNAFITYHLDMMQMRVGVDKKNVPELYQRFLVYLKYCAEHNIMPNNMNAYFAIGVTRGEISNWYTGKAGTPEHRQFAEDIKAFFSSIHEQAGIDGLTNPILTIWWQKAHDGMVEAQKIEQVEESPLGDRQTAESIAAKWSEVELPE